MKYCICGAPLKNPVGSGRKQQFCSKACKQKAYRLRLKRNTEAPETALRNDSNPGRLRIVPCTIAKANAFVKQVHRHHGTIPIARFALGVADETGRLRGVAIVGRPCNTHLDDGWTLEVRRLATDGCKNACSMLYAASWKAAKAIGYRRLITYTLPTESQASLKAVGWTCITNCGGKSWKSSKRNRQDTPLTFMKKNRWEVTISKG